MNKARTAIGGNEIAREHWSGLREETAKMVHWMTDGGINKRASL
jgi:hypothetical protein